MKQLIACVIALGLTGCATLSPNAPILSEKLGKSLEQSAKDKMDLISLFNDQSVGRINDYIEYRYAPELVDEFLEDGEFLKVFCDLNGLRDRSLEMLSAMGSLMTKIERRRKERLSAKNKIVRSLKRSNRERSSYELEISRDLTRELVSVSKDAASRRKVFEAAKEAVPFSEEIENAVSKIDELVK